MPSERNIDPFAALILVLSIIGIILIAAFSFAGFYWPGPYAGNRYSCLSCEYWTSGDLAAQVLMLILLIVQIVIAINDLIPKRFVERDLSIYGMGLAVLTILMAIIGIASFGVAYDAFNWWPETGFYGGIIAGILNTILFFLKFRNK
ncbi:MAG: hypothetical protein ACFE75_03910 [Candidatus Hodarchaeota archaeon]